MGKQLTSIELCAGAGGQALGLELAGFEHLALVELDSWACATLRHNRPGWNVLHGDVSKFDATGYQGVDLVAAGVPCPPFSVAGKQLGPDDDRDLFPAVLEIVKQCNPKAVMIENVRGIFDSVFDAYRAGVISTLEDLGYKCDWRLLNACDFGVPQLRPRAVLVALQASQWTHFSWPTPNRIPAPSVGEALLEEMSAGGWPGGQEWAARASSIAPTLVGGSKKHGGPDLGPSRARQAWLRLGVDGGSLADAPPPANFSGTPRLTVKMAAILQGFPRDWVIVGKKTPAYRQIGNAFPPPVAKAVGAAIAAAIERDVSLTRVA